MAAAPSPCGADDPDPDRLPDPSGTAARAHTGAGVRAVAGTLAPLSRVLLTLIGVLLIGVALLTLAARLGLPFVAGYKDDIEASLSETLGQPVAIERLALAWRGSGPVLDAQGLAIGKPSGTRITVDAALIDLHAFASLWRRHLVLNELTLVGAELQLVRFGAGRYALRGVGERPGRDEVADRQASEDPLQSARWLFNAGRVGLVDSRLLFIDRPSGQRVALSALSVVAQNDDDLHRLRIDVDLPDELGERIELGVDLAPIGSRTTLSSLKADLHLRSNRVALAALGEWLPALGVAPAASSLSGRIDASLATELWGRIEKGRLRHLRGRLELADVRDITGALPRGVPDALNLPIRVQLDEQGRWQLDADGSEVVRGTQRLRIDRLRAGLDPSQTPLRWHIAARGPVIEGEGGGQPLDLLAGLAALVPPALAPGALGWVTQARPQGDLHAWRIDLASPSQGRTRPVLGLDADVRALRLQPVGGVPGVDALDVTLQLSGRTGRLGVRPADRIEGGDVRQARVFAPRWRSDALTLSALDVDLSIERLAGNGWRLGGPVSVASNSFEADARVAVTLDADPSPLVDVHGSFALGDARDLPALLPDRLLGSDTSAWFERAFQGGSASDGQLLLFGRVADFPFERGEGVFRADARVEALTLDWLAEWPVASELRGRVSVDGVSVRSRAQGGRVGQMTIDRATLAIDDLRAPHLELDASGGSGAAALLTFATQGPLASILAPAFEGASGAGRVGMDLRVAAPLSDAAFRRHGPLAVDGSLFFDGNRLGFAQADIELEQVTGGVSFDQDGARMNRVRATWLGRPLRLDANTAGEGVERAMTLTMQGVMAADEVLAHHGLPLDRWVSGASPWRARLLVPFDTDRLDREGVTLVATSELVGTRVLMPVPLGKPADRPARIQVSTAFLPGEPVVRWRVAQNGDGLPDIEALADVAGAELLSLSLGLGALPADPSGRPGIRLDGAVDTLDADGWIEALATLIEDIEAAEAAVPDQVEQPILAVSGEVQVNDMTLRRAPLGEARLRIDTDARYLNVALDNRWMSGNLRYPRRSVGLDGQLLPLTARLERVDGRIIDALMGDWDTTPEAGSDEPAGGPDPRTLPPIEARIASIGWGPLEVTELTLRTRPAASGLDVTAIGFTHRDLQVFGEGRWRLVDPQAFDADARPDAHRTALAMTVQSSDFESGLAGIGLSDLLGGTAGRATATIGWPGPLWLPDLASLDGDLQLALEQGRVVPLEPGAGRLIGLFALQTLPRRLSLDFSDLMLDGLAFNTLDGSATLEDGVLDTSLLRLTGPVGVIDISGRTDLVAQTLEQRITVLPRVSAALPIIGAISGGASAGIGVLVAGGLLKALGVDFDRIGLREYTLDGPWAEPRLEPASR